ncbi:hypothetical protein V2G26_005483 [Clonostachys chloroleuca]
MMAYESNTIQRQSLRALKQNLHGNRSGSQEVPCPEAYECSLVSVDTRRCGIFRSKDGESSSTELSPISRTLSISLRSCKLKGGGLSMKKALPREWRKPISHANKSRKLDLAVWVCPGASKKF